MPLPHKRGWSQPMKVTKKGNALLKDRERTSAPRAEFLIKFASMSDEQFEKWSELKTTAEARAFMEAIPMPPMKTNKMFIEVEKQEGSKK
jgi:hypothetical protein